jgi:hypothetical protein
LKGKEKQEMRKTLMMGVVVALCLGFGGAALAADAGVLPFGLSGTFGVDFSSAYFDDLNNTKYSKSAVLQPYLIIKHKSGFWIAANPTFGVAGNYEPATDYRWSFGWEKANLYKGFGVNLSVQYRDLPPTWYKTGDYWGPRAEVNYPITLTKSQTLTPYIVYTYMMSANNGNSSKDNGVGTVGARYNWKSGKWSADVTAAASYDWGVYGQTSATFGRAEGSFNYYIGKGLSWKIVQAGAVVPFSSQPKREQRSDTDGWVGTGFEFKF